MIRAAVNRRGVLRGAGAGLIAVSVGAVSVGAATRYLTPGEAHAANLPLFHLTVAEQACLGAMGEIMVPGATSAGLAHYVDDQLGRAPAESLLFARYLDLEGPLVDFYRDGFSSIDRLGAVTGGQTFARLEWAKATELVRSVLAGTAICGTPTIALFCAAIRNDAIDVVYGGPDGMERLGIPVMQHSPAPTPW